MRYLILVNILVLGFVVIGTSSLIGVKPGACPSVKIRLPGICWQQCSSDFECQDDYKCCSNGCGNLCMPPVVVTQGSCPAVKKGVKGICVQGCSSDDECGSGQKCCSNGCGHVCTVV